jgi:hypothetical protein
MQSQTNTLPLQERDVSPERERQSPRSGGHTPKSETFSPKVRRKLQVPDEEVHYNIRYPRDGEHAHSAAQHSQITFIDELYLILYPCYKCSLADQPIFILVDNHTDLGHQLYAHARSLLVLR